MTRTGTAVRAVLTAAAMLAVTSAVHAQTPGQEFGPPTDILRDNVPALPLLYTAYAFVWVALIGYVFLLWRRIGQVERELADVRGRLAQRK
jgi:CcmD family protein